ncbi:MAG TPA: hypothetical protein VGE45_00440 [Chloroflexia bacterium]|jgi:hypothetical protein
MAKPQTLDSNWASVLNEVGNRDGVTVQMQDGSIYFTPTLAEKMVVMDGADSVEALQSVREPNFLRMQEMQFGGKFYATYLDLGPIGPALVKQHGPVIHYRLSRKVVDD